MGNLGQESFAVGGPEHRNLTRLHVDTREGGHVNTGRLLGGMLGAYQDSTVGTLRAIDGGGILEHDNLVNILDVDTSEWSRDLTLDHRGTKLLILNNQAIQHKERIVGAMQGIDATQIKVRTTPVGARTELCLQTRDNTLQGSFRRTLDRDGVVALVDTDSRHQVTLFLHA